MRRPIEEESIIDWDEADNNRFQCKVLHQNVQMCSNKLAQLEIVVEELNPDFVCLSEHGMKEYELVGFTLPGYKIVANYCREHYNGGGVLICAKVGLMTEQYMNEDQINLCVDKEIEFAAIKIINGNHFILIVIYRSPQGNVETFLEKLTDILSVCVFGHKQVVICGDFNMDVLKENKVSKTFIEVLNTYGVRATINVPTRTVTTVSGTSATAIDNILTNVNDKLYKTSVVVTALADHDAQMIELFPTRTTSTVESPTYNKVYRTMGLKNIETFYQKLTVQSWQIVYNQNNVNSKYEVFADIINCLFNVSFPLRKIKTNGKVGLTDKLGKRWITPQIRGLREKIKKTANRLKLTKNNDIRIDLQKYKKEYRQLIREAKANALREQIRQSKCKSRTLWQHINKDRNRKSTHNDLGINIQLQSEEGLLTTSTEEAVSLLNQYFSEAPNKILEQDRKINNSKTNFKPLPDSGIVFELQHVSESEVLGFIHRLKNTKSAGPDRISSSLLKQCAYPLIRPLTHLINTSFDEGTFPYALKLAKVTPIFKGGNRKDVSCYRPISNLNAISKVFEMAMSDKLLTYMEENNLISKKQHGFRQKRSTETAIASLVDTVLSELDQHKHVLILQMDLSKAFDCVNSSILVNKMYSYGVRGYPLQWIHSYLHGRSQYVSITDRRTNQEFRSGSTTLKMGVPQGSILGPPFFNFHVNDLPDSITLGDFLMYADDSTAILSHEVLDELIVLGYITLEVAAQWLQENYLVLNLNKTKIMLVSRKKSAVNKLIHLEANDVQNTTIEQVENIELLGLTIDKKLNWNLQCDLLAKKLSGSLFVLRKLKMYNNREVLLLAYHALIVSHISYGIVAWGWSSKDNVRRIFSKQKRAIRIICNIGNRESCRGLFRALGLLTLPSLYIMKTILYVRAHKPDILTNADLHCYDTRRRMDVHVVAHNLESYKKGPTFAGANFFNALPLEIKSLDNFKIFKKNLKVYMLEKEFYSVEEMLDRD